VTLNVKENRSYKAICVRISNIKFLRNYSKGNGVDIYDRVYIKRDVHTAT
jgi:hypothetical protein